ncbi:MAG: serine--tRNA ligase [Bacilli bacterium]|jgi:seryl-tRNA synthetase|nr:serine--tRNA ligase [Bacilli bacterium]MDD4005545.1 serine--tRNA ligase [Bacilli bacterium]
MLDIKLITENPEKIRLALKKKNYEVDFAPLIALVEERKKLLVKVESSKAEQNRLSGSVAQIKKSGGDVASIFARVKELALESSGDEASLKKIEAQIFNFMAVLPNVPDEDLLEGGKENNEVIYEYGKKPVFDFKIKDHVELAESLGLVDYERAAKISGHGTWIYTGQGALLEWALINYFIANHLKDGYQFMLPPHLLNYESGFVAGQFPKFNDAVFMLEGASPKKFMLPTAETALVNIHRNEILDIATLPRKYFAYTPCYRSEAGSYRTEERGMIRGYQFNKVEIVQYTTEEGSNVAFEEMVGKAKRLVEQLGLHFQISKLAAGDCSHAMARTYDIEVYIPSMATYKEVSSASNARDYQARRGMMRYRDKDSGKMKFCHTLNASGLATSRLVPAILEQFQQADGSVIVPEVLRPYMGGLEKLEAKK